MKYNVIFSKYGLVFMIMLLITLFIKKRNLNTKSKLYISLIFISVIFALFDILVTYILKINGPSGEFIRICWNLRNSFLHAFIFTFVWYIIIIIREVEYSSLLEMFIKRKGFLITLIFLAIINIASIIGGDFPYMTYEKLDYTGGRGFYASVFIMMCSMLWSLFITLKHGRDKRNVINSILISLLLLSIAVPFQFVFPHVSFMPFLLMYIMMIFYYNFENPDIELLKDVTVLKKQIDKSSNTKTDFLFNLSHELINPVNVIVSLSESLNNVQSFDREEVIKDLNSIKYAGNTLLDSINNILDLSEIDSSDKKIVEREYSLYELLNRLKTVAVSRIGAKQIIFEMNVDDNINSKYYGDITKIQRVLLNILTNAAKYTEVGKIILNVSCTIEKDIHILHFSVVDTGIGIKEEILPIIFTDENNSDTAGAGLELSKKYIDMMNGKISVKSVYRAGSTFIVDIPQRACGNRLISEDKREDEKIDYNKLMDCSKYKALIVDDDNLDIKVTKKLLQKYNFQITATTSTMDCLRKIKSGEEYDILFLDYKMPELDGVETMKALRQLSFYKIPIIVCLTANASVGAKEMYISEGFDDYLSKPIDTEELDRIIRKNFSTK